MENLSTGTSLHSVTGDSGGSGSADGEQHLTIFRVGSLLTGGHRDLCLVKKVSQAGALIRAYGKLRAGDVVRLELKGQAAIDGTVASLDGTDTRIAFEQAIDVSQLLKVGPGGPPPRMPRIEVRAFALIRQGAVVHRANIHNISQGGISAECKADLEVGADATVTLAGMGPQQGVVRWSGSGGCGITFNTVLGLPQLVEWLHAHTSTKAASA
ncbi:MAG: PilZ domain-containing protein [Sphingomonas sp.]|nr:PilZ domain-containing protein [Sphingomonas sp.]